MWKPGLMMVGVLFAVKWVQAGEVRLACPGELAAGAIRSEDPYPGWELYNPNKLVLRSASFMAGSPGKMMDLVPFEVRDYKGATQERWKFDGGEAWLRCSYGEAGQITLSKKIEGAPSECMITYRRNSPASIQCTNSLR